MSHTLLRQQALDLRNKGKTYNEIRDILHVAKSTLSGWLRNYPLTEQQLLLLENKIKNKRYITIEKVRNIKAQKRIARIEATYNEQRQKWDNLSLRELELAGLFLYWGEGAKDIQGQISICNTDAKVLQFALYWYNHVLNVPNEKLRVYLHLYSDMNISQEIEYWSKVLSLPKAQFMKPYVKISTRSKINHKGFGHGTCSLTFRDVILKEKIIMGIKAIADKYSEL